MTRIVLDASALLAVVNGEPGSEKLPPELLAGAGCSTVNLAEAQGKLVNLGLSPDDAWKVALTPVAEVIAFDAEHARLAGSLVTHTRALGLSLGDRACLALGITLKLPVYTADRAWKDLSLRGLRIHVIR